MASASCVAPPATCHARSSVACSGYVGQGARPAAEYHEHDFDWEEHAAAVRHIVEAQEAAGRALRAAKQVFSDAEEGTASERVAASLAGAACAAAAGDGHRPEQQAAAAAAVALAERPREDQSAPSTDATSTSSSSLSQGAASWRNKGRQAGLGGGALSAAAAAESAASGGVPAASTSYEGDRWEEFYKAHPSARFFKERRYLLLEFPFLTHPDCRHVVEIGAGCGSSILPVLKANPGSRTTCTDISTTCLEQLLAAAHAEGVDRSRVAVFPADATDPAAAHLFNGLAADALLIMFTLSAVPPQQQLVMLQHAWRSLAPGGRLLIRDHGLYDMVQLRIPPEQWVGPNLYKRGDGTMAYFFSLEDMAARATQAGFDITELKYVTVVNRNRKSGLELRRVFIHCVFTKPGAA
ncbi:hypothetical protein CHLRE_16g668100v5 [Chlamydomonas reinhardtii]|uniref:Methyltransferase type 12 domain-containing protein n=1 Tax=Chlamydomonas reinhardtii TaxID=3055 RepID=A0A2K3CUF5_CHLRE|nr:uncharacterized protein CHLRE_16g668100v5 [Chlamydomonas reinhardtii]PNW71911.1 hypothetical protein CHLRE_16g668100v5 [Chlamydomonas reinhardtii]